MIIRRRGRDQGLMRIHQMLGKVWSREGGQGQLSASSSASKITRRDTRSHRVRVMSRTSTWRQSKPGAELFTNYPEYLRLYSNCAIINIFKLPHLPFQ